MTAKKNTVTRVTWDDIFPTGGGPRFGVTCSPAEYLEMMKPKAPAPPLENDGPVDHFGPEPHDRRGDD